MCTNCSRRVLENYTMRQVLRASLRKSFYFGVLCFIGVLFVVLQRQKHMVNVVKQFNNKHIVGTRYFKHDDTTGNINTVDVPQFREKKKRPGLIIMGYSRSGTSYMDTVFNHDPEIFTVHEPLQIPNRWREKGADFEFVYDSAVSDVIGAHLNCDFTKNNITRQYLVDFGDYWRFRKQSRALSSPPFCVTPGMKESCSGPLDPEEVSYVCVNKYKASVIKICYERIPPRPVCKLGFVVQLVELFEAIYPEIDVKILNLVRDPRGMINSRININWIAEYPDENLGKESARLCNILEKIVQYGRSLTGIMRTKYRELKYDDFFSNPIQMTEELYKFAGFHQVPDIVKEYIRLSTQPPEQIWEQAEKQWGSVIRNSTRNLERWKREGSFERNKVIEQSCQNIFQLLNLKHWAWDPNQSAS